MSNPLTAVLAFLHGLWAKEPTRITSAIVAVVLFVAAKVGVVIPEADILEALGLILPVLFGGEVVRRKVTPTR